MENKTCILGNGKFLSGRFGITGFSFLYCLLGISADFMCIYAILVWHLSNLECNGEYLLNHEFCLYCAELYTLPYCEDILRFSSWFISCIGYQKQIFIWFFNGRADSWWIVIKSAFHALKCTLERIEIFAFQIRESNSNLTFFKRWCTLSLFVEFMLLSCVLNFLCCVMRRLDEKSSELNEIILFRFWVPHYSIVPFSCLHSLLSWHYMNIGCNGKVDSC